MAKLSIIIPAYNRHTLTVRAYQESMNGSYIPDELIVVNDGGTQDLRDMLYSIPRKTNVVYARIEQDIPWGYNMACNVGFWLSIGDIFILQDTDHIPARNTFEETMKFFQEHPECDRLAYNRNCINIMELAKPMEEWAWTKGWGPNQMVAALRRDIYLKLKAQDERFCGRYGYMAYDWKDRYNNILKIKTMKSNANYHTIIGDGGEPGLVRGMSPINRRFYRENSLKGHPQHPGGILNCTYQFERWGKNI